MSYTSWRFRVQGLAYPRAIKGLRPLYGLHLGGCQNMVPFLDPYYNTAPNT